MVFPLVVLIHWLYRATLITKCFLSKYPEFFTSSHYCRLLSSLPLNHSQETERSLISSMTKKTEVLGINSLITPRSWATDDLRVTSALWGDGKGLAWSLSAPGLPGRPHKCLAKNRLL